MTLRERVINYIRENFIDGSVTVEDFGLFPGGVIVRDKQGGEMLVYVDILTDDIKTLVR